MKPREVILRLDPVPAGTPRVPAANGPTFPAELERPPCENHPPAEQLATIYCRACGAWKPHADAPLVFLPEASR